MCELSAFSLGYIEWPTERGKSERSSWEIGKEEAGVLSAKVSKESYRE
jgi:hypothetical protein